MGFLEAGEPLDWDEATETLEYVSTHGLWQLLGLWRRHAPRQDTSLYWGDEIEFAIVTHRNSTCQLLLEADRVIDVLKKKEQNTSDPMNAVQVLWNPEFGNHMVEAIPYPPFKLSTDSILDVEQSMRIRRMKIQSVLSPDDFVVTLASFPRFGLKSFSYHPKGHPDATIPQPHPESSGSQSIFIPDVLVNPHPRFSTLVKNIRQRRKAKPVIVVPLYKDLHSGEQTNKVNVSKENDWSLSQPFSTLNRFSIQDLSQKTMNPIKDHVYMDAFAFGMGNCCLQTTHMCANVSQARYLYDQLLVLSPFFLALSAATSVVRGFLVDTDTRWKILEQAVDCRTQHEKTFIKKSRFSASSLYIADGGPLQINVQRWNDTHVPVNKKAQALLLDHKIDPLLALHFAYLWIRDPMVIFRERIFIDDERMTDHFENIQSTNWNSVRFKPPPISHSPDDSIGWRVECRTPDVQLTDFENAALVSLMTVLVQVILTNTVDFYIPMSMNDTNMIRSNDRYAIRRQRFFYRIRGHDTASQTEQEEQIQEWSLEDIFCGTHDGRLSPGLIPLCEEFVNAQYKQNQCTEKAMRDFHHYASFLKCRLSGKLVTDAQFIREFVMHHPCYQQDSVVNQIIANDIVVVSFYIGFNLYKPKRLLGRFSLTPSYEILHQELFNTLRRPQFSKQLTEQLMKQEGYLSDFPLALLTSDMET